MNRQPFQKQAAAIALTTAALVSALTSSAGDYGKVVINDNAPIASSSWCDLFKHNTLYRGEGVIRSVKLKGRYHGQWVSQSEDTFEGGVAATNGYHGYAHRRLRLGTEIALAGDLVLTTVFNVADGTGGAGGHGLTNGPFFDDWNEFNLAWRPDGDFYLVVGKQKQLITREFSTSSNQIFTVERSAITSAVVSDYPWGAAAGFSALGLKHELGAWFFGADRDSTGDRYDWPDLRSRGGASYRVAHDLTAATRLHFDYQYTNNSRGLADPRGSADRNLGSAFEHVASIGTESKFGDFGVVTDFIYADNGLASGTLPAGYDTWGLVLMPYYNLTDKLQLVTRYAYMGEGREQRPQRFDVRQSVEDYHTFYAGLNYHLCGHNLKIMAGYEYATGNLHGGAGNVETSSWMLALRTSF